MTHHKIHRTLLLLTALVAAAPAGTALAVGWNPAGIDGGPRKLGGAGIKYYLRGKNGNDNKTGLAPNNAWATFAKAMSVLKTGDTLYVGASTYIEKIEVKNSGTFGGVNNPQSILLFADTAGTFTGDAGPVIVYNTSEHGIKVDGRTGIEIDGFTVVRNGLPAADKKFYGLYSHNSSVLVRNCEFAKWTNGIYSTNTDPAFINCSFHDNRAWGVASELESLTLTDCTVEANPKGGVANYRDIGDKAILSTDPVVLLTNCKVNNNPRYNVMVLGSTTTLDGTEVTNGSGFGVLVYRGYFNFLNNYKITGNLHGVFLHGRDEDHAYDVSLNGLRVDKNSGVGLTSYFYDLTLTNSTFNENGQTGFVECFGDLTATGCSATKNGNGGFFFFAYQRLKDNQPISYGSADFTNCTASQNSFHGLYCFCADVSLENCTFTNNQNHGAYVVARNFKKHPDPKLIDDGYDVKVLQPWWDTFVWAYTVDKNPYQYDGQVFMANSTVTGNGSNGCFVHGYDWEKDVKLSKKKKNYRFYDPTSLVVDKCTISSNGGMGLSTEAVDIQATQVVLQSNSGWGVSALSGLHSLENCLVTDNGKGVCMGLSGTASSSRGVSIWNCTIANNTGGYGVFQDVPALTVANTIVSGNGSYGLCQNSGTMTHHHNLVYGHGQDFVGATVDSTELVSDPRFLDAAAKNYQLSANSRAINKGDDATTGVIDDLLGRVRPQYGHFEIGAYEYPFPSGVRAITKWKESK